MREWLRILSGVLVLDKKLGSSVARVLQSPKSLAELGLRLQTNNVE